MLPIISVPAAGRVWRGSPQPVLVALNWVAMTRTSGHCTDRRGRRHPSWAGKGLDAPLQILFGQVAEHADVLALCGDLTDRGDPEEARLMAKALATVTVPIVAVLGNHDYECGKEREVARILCDAGVHVLDGDAHEVLGVGFAGVKGFAGGFGRRALGPLGRAADQAVRAGGAGRGAEAGDRAGPAANRAARWRCCTTRPSPPPWRESRWRSIPTWARSRLEEPLTRYPVDVVFHGHAHHGAPEGRTMGDVPVYNVSMVLLQRTFPDRPAFRVVELAVGRQRR